VVRVTFGFLGVAGKLVDSTVPQAWLPSPGMEPGLSRAEYVHGPADTRSTVGQHEFRSDGKPPRTALSTSSADVDNANI